MADAERQERLAAKQPQRQKRRRQQKREEKEEKEKKTKKTKQQPEKRKADRIETQETKTAEERKRAKSAKGTVWAYVLEQQGTDPPNNRTYKLCLNFKEYPAAANVGHLAKSVEDVFYESGYFVPEETTIFRENPFATEVHKRDRNATYHLRNGVRLLDGSLDNSNPISDADREERQPFYVLVSKLRERQPAMDVAAMPSAAAQAELLPVNQIPGFLLTLVKPEDFQFSGLLYDPKLQRDKFGRFVKTSAVIPFLPRHGGDPIFDSRFAPFLPDTTDESKMLETAGDYVMLETAGTGKTRALLDLGRRRFLIYVKCDPPLEEDRSFSTEEVTVTEDVLFRAMIKEIKQNCLSERTNEGFINKARGYILADICARLYFMYWMVTHFEDRDVTAEKFLVAQLTGGREVMLKFFEYLCRYPADTLRELAHNFQFLLPGQYIAPRWAIDEAQVAEEYFGEGSTHYFMSSDGEHKRSLLREYIALLKSTEAVGATALTVAGTNLTTFDTKAKAYTALGKQGEGRSVDFPVLTEDDVKERLGNVLNLEHVDWNEVDNLSLLTGRCRWSAALVDLICEVESTVRKKFRRRLAQLPSKATVIKRAIQELRSRVVARILKDIEQRLSARMSENHRAADTDLIRRVFVICNLFDNQANGIQVFFTANEVVTLLSLGLGQFLSPESGLRGVHDTPVVFDRMTAEALNEYAAQRDVPWTVADSVAKWLSDQYSNQTPHTVGVKFQIVVAAALHGLPQGMTVAQFAKEVAQASGETIADEDLPDWTKEAVIVPVGFVSLKSATEVLEFFKNPKPGVVVEPDDSIRPDGVGVFESNGWRFLVAYSAKLWSRSLSGDDRDDDIASLHPDSWYDVKPSVKRKREQKAKQKAAETKQSRNEEESQTAASSSQQVATEETNAEQQRAAEADNGTNHRVTWQQRLNILRQTTGTRELKLYVNPAGYSALQDKRTDPANGIVKGQLKRVHVQGDTVRIIIDGTNSRALFRSDQQQRLLAELTSRVQEEAQQQEPAV